MRKFLKLCMIFFMFSLSIFTVQAQDREKRGQAVVAQCGSIIDSEFSSNYEEQNFSIDVNAGDALDISVIPLGTQLKTSILITGPTNLGIGMSMGWDPEPSYFIYNEVEQQPKINSGILSATGKYTIRVINFQFYTYYYDRDDYNSPSNAGGVGAYTVYIGCTLRDGTVINPGDTASEITEATATPTEYINPLGELVATFTPTPSFSGIGFPGLSPVDFSQAFLFPLIVGQSNNGQMPTNANAVVGYTLDAAASDILDLTFTRLSGNLNLGLVVLSSDNQVVFQASLITSTTLNTRFTLPSAGQYTIGVFRIDLIPPETPEATAFQLQGSLNP
jgi:hypothetical protein